jgi:tripartite-type tricarboxylate transporter receptor subunit TctC
MSALLGLSAVRHAQAQAPDKYPSRPLQLSHGFGAGGNGDVISRIIADGLSARLGQPVVVEPRPGAGGNIASARLAKSAPDGYSLITLTGGHAVSGALYKSLPFDPVNDFQMLSIYGYLAFVVAVKADGKIKSMADLIAVAKAAPGKLNFSSVGVGSTQHLAGELLCAMAGIKMVHIPFKGGSAPMTALLGGQIDVLVDSITVAGPQIAAGKVRALGVTSPQPWWSEPSIPPIATAVPGYDVRTWLGMATVKGVPQPIVERLNSELRVVLAMPATKEKLGKIGVDVRASSPQEMRDFVAAEIGKWKKVVAEANIPQR